MNAQNTTTQTRHERLNELIARLGDEHESLVAETRLLQEQMDDIILGDDRSDEARTHYNELAVRHMAAKDLENATKNMIHSLQDFTTGHRSNEWLIDQ